jgi:ribosomal protein S18 acetylase RimI-like enzyme
MSFNLQAAKITQMSPIMGLFEEGRKWHGEMKVSEWPVFELARVLDDIDNDRLFVLMDKQLVVGSVTISESDPLIWSDNTPALYIHRLVVARDLKGLNLGKLIVDKIEEKAIERDKSALRLDCWANNERLKSYYERIGFVKLTNVTIGDVPSLPLHYRNSTTTLFQRRCGRPSLEAAQEAPTGAKELLKLSEASTTHI